MSVLRDQTDALHRLFDGTVGRELADQLIGLGNAGRLAETSALASLYKRRLWTHAWRRHPVRTTVTTVRTVGHGLMRRLRPSGLEIVIASPIPGAAARVCDLFAHAPARCIPGSGAEYVRDDERKPGRSMLVDAWRDRLMSSRGRLARMTFLFRDTHPIVQSVNSNGSGRLLAAFAPKPDLLVVLDVSPAVIRGAEPSISAHDAIRRRNAYLDLADKWPNTNMINGAQTPDTLMDDVISLIRAETTARTRLRFVRPRGASGSTLTNPNTVEVVPAPLVRSMPGAVGRKS